MRRNQITSFAWNGPVHLNTTSHAQKPDFVFPRETDRVHLNLPGVEGASVQSTAGQPRCPASAAVMLDTPCSEVVWRVLATHCIRQFPPFNSPPVRHRVPSHFNWSLPPRNHSSIPRQGQSIFYITETSAWDSKTRRASYWNEPVNLFAELSWTEPEAGY